MKRSGVFLLIILMLSGMFRPGALKVYASVGDTFTTEGITYKILKDSQISNYSREPGEVSIIATDKRKVKGDINVASTIRDQSGNQYYVTDVAPFAFAGTEITSIKLPYRVGLIGDGAFAGCTSLTSFKCPDACMRLGIACFSHCTSLYSFTISSSIFSIGDGCFSYCPNLESLSLDAVSQYFCISDGYLMNASRTRIIYGYKASGDVVIPATVQFISQYAFEGNPNITSVRFNDQIDTIERGTFTGCKNLKSVDLTGIRFIRKDAFCDCPSISDINIPASVSSIQFNPFGYCDGLKSFTVDDNNPNYSARDGMLLNKKGNALVSGNALKGKIILDGAVRTVNEYAFYGNTRLESITFTASLKNIGDYAFLGCSNLERARFSSRKTVITGKDAFKNSNYYLELSFPYAKSVGGEGSIEEMLKELSPKGALITYWTK